MERRLSPCLILQHVWPSRWTCWSLSVTSSSGPCCWASACTLSHWSVGWVWSSCSPGCPSTSSGSTGKRSQSVSMIWLVSILASSLKRLHKLVGLHCYRITLNNIQWGVKSTLFLLKYCHSGTLTVVRFKTNTGSLYPCRVSDSSGAETVFRGFPPDWSYRYQPIPRMDWQIFSQEQYVWEFLSSFTVFLFLLIFRHCMMTDLFRLLELLVWSLIIWNSYPFSYNWVELPEFLCMGHLHFFPSLLY